MQPPSGLGACLGEGARPSEVPVMKKAKIGKEMKGFEIGVNMMFITVFALIGVGLALLAFAATTEYFPQLQDWLNNLFNETLSPDDESNYMIAKNSMKALVCAINSVATGQEYTADGCSGFYTKSPPETGDESGSIFPDISDLPFEPEYGAGDDSDQEKPEYLGFSTGNIISKDYSDFMTGLAAEDDSGGGSDTNTKIVCEDVAIEKETVKATRVRFLHTGDIVYTADNIPNKEKYFDCSSYNPEGEAGLSFGIECYTCGDNKRIGNTQKCEKTVTTDNICTIYNFYLPQKVSDAQDWILGYGDPKFLVYWQTFPMDQDTWTYKSDWKITAAIIAISALPPTKIVGGLAKAGFKTVGTKIENLISRKASASAVRATLKENMKNELKNVISKRLANQKIRTITKAGVLQGASLVAAQVDSKSAIYEEDPNSVVLKTPYEEKNKLALSDELKGKPVLTHWDPGAISSERATPAHLVSPCKIDSMQLRMARVTCNHYTYNMKTGMVDCDNDKETGKEIEFKGERVTVFETVMDKLLGNGNLPECNLESYLGSDNYYFKSFESISAMKINHLINQIKMNMLKHPEEFEYVEIYYDNENPVDENGNPVDFDYIEDNPGTDFWEGGLSGGGGATRSFGEALESDEAVTHKLRIKINDRDLDFIDSDFDGYFDSYSMRNCNIDAPVITKINENKDYEDNYCKDDRGGFQKTLKYGGFVVGTAGAITAGFVTGGWAWIAGSVAYLGTISSAVNFIYEGSWPH